jgi:hypothetical protein
VSTSPQVSRKERAGSPRAPRRSPLTRPGAACAGRRSGSR